MDWDLGCVVMTTPLLVTVRVAAVLYTYLPSRPVTLQRNIRPDSV